MLKVTKWASFQSYKDRRPPWIRLHKSLLDNFEFQTMSMEAKAILPMLWLLASEDEDPVAGCIRDRYEKIAFRLRIDAETLRKVIDECVDAGFLEVIDDETGEPIRSPKQQVTDSLQNSYETVTPEYRDRDRVQRQRQRTETDSCSERSPRSKPTDDSPVVHVLKPLAGKRTEVAITEKQVGTFLQAYPGVDVHAELRRMNAWLEANPQRRKTSTGALKFVNNWLSRAQNEATAVRSTGPPSTGQKRSLYDVSMENARRAKEDLFGISGGGVYDAG